MLHITKGTLIADRYELVRPLASGAMGAVWVARHRQLDSPVAIKFMAASFAASTEARARFEREAKAAAQVRSIHIVPVVDYGIEDDMPYLVMELLLGEDLKTRLGRVGRLPLAETVEVVTQVARAVRRAHEAGIIHRDLKPANIFISQNDEVEIYRVVDFGVAKALGIGPTNNPTQTGQVLGSPAYMSPEQARGAKTVDTRTDLWSLAVIAYRCLAGKLPFLGGGMPEMLVSIARDPAPPPSSHLPELPPALDPFFERALAKNPDDRFPTAAELAGAFAEAAGVRPRGRETAGSMPEPPVRPEAVTGAARPVPSSLRDTKRTMPMAVPPDAVASTTVPVGTPVRKKVSTIVMSPEARAARPSPHAGSPPGDGEREPAAEEATASESVSTLPRQEMRTGVHLVEATVSQSASTLPRQEARADMPLIEAPSSESVSTLPKQETRTDVPVIEAPSSESVSTLPKEVARAAAPVLHEESPASESLPTVPTQMAPAPVLHEEPPASERSEARRSPPPSAMVVADHRTAARPDRAVHAQTRRRWLMGGMLAVVAVVCGIAMLAMEQRADSNAQLAGPAGSGKIDSKPADTAPTTTASTSAAVRPQVKLKDNPTVEPQTPPPRPKPAPAPPAAPPPQRAANPHRMFGTEN